MRRPILLPKPGSIRTDSPLHVQAFAEFEILGEEEVRRRLVSDGLHFTRQRPARDWLLLQEAKTKARAEERTEESILISKQALENSRFAIVVSIIAIAVSAGLAILLRSPL